MTGASQFTLPTSWVAEPYPTHHSFAYEGDPSRNDFDFRVEFSHGVPEAERLAVIALLEAAPVLLAALRCALADLEGSKQAMEQGDIHLHDWKAHQLSIVEAQEAIAAATGKEGA